MKYTLAHVTHEAVEKIGGIGTVLEGLITSPIYQQHVGRTILIGPCSTSVAVDPRHRLGEHGKVLYSGVDNIDEAGLARRLHPIEWAFNVSIIYGTRTYDIPGDNRKGEAEVLLIDVFQINKDRMARFKHALSEKLGLDSMKYEGDWGYEEYVRLAEPAYYALTALLKDEELPCILFSHEFMGLPTAFKATIDGSKYFRTVFHAHECSTARTVVEHHPGHDTMFYNVLEKAREQGKYVGDVFGSFEGNARHALISRAHLCDGIIAVGDHTAAEMHFLERHFDHHHIDLVYNGVPNTAVTPKQKSRSRAMLLDYCEKLLSWRPDWLMTHVMRPVISKAVWRDLGVCHELDQEFKRTGERAVLIVLTSGGGVRRPQDIRQMESEYNWPLNHREGYPDLVGPEVDFHRMFEAFNRDHDNVRVVLVNQFGWSRERIGEAVPKDMHMGDFRIATDVEFGMACYEPFGISPLEPLCAGAICVISNVCGCAGFVNEVTGGKATPNVIIADYTQLKHAGDLDQLLAMTEGRRHTIEQCVSKQIAAQLLATLPRTDKQRGDLLKSGRQLADAMGWDYIVSDHLLPMLKRVV